jgi:hypothetical protein
MDRIMPCVLFVAVMLWQHTSWYSGRTHSNDNIRASVEKSAAAMVDVNVVCCYADRKICWFSMFWNERITCNFKGQQILLTAGDEGGMLPRNVDGQ